MIFRTALLRELAAAAAATFFVLVGIVITMLLLRLLGQAASGAITSTGIVALLGCDVNYLPVLISLTLFISVDDAHAQLPRLRMIVWFSCGIGLTQWIRRCCCCDRWCW
jgi:lipopolysaccharide export system permease protein